MYIYSKLYKALYLKITKIHTDIDKITYIIVSKIQITKTTIHVFTFKIIGILSALLLEYMLFKLIIEYCSFL